MIQRFTFKLKGVFSYFSGALAREARLRSTMGKEMW